MFGGELLGPASGGCGGIVGYARNNLTIINCLFAPSGYFLGSETIASEPFVRIRYSDRVWLDNNYSTILFFPSEKAGELFEITADSALEMRLRDYTEYKTSKVKVSPAGIDYDSHIYAAEGQGVPLYLHWRGSSASDTAYLTPSAGTLSGSNDNYTLTMPNEEVNIRLASEKVSYVDAAGNAKGSIGARILSGDATEWNGGWCVVKENTTIDSRVTVTGDVNLILCDGAELTVSKGINVAEGKSLTIYGQTGCTGKLIITSPENHYAALGGGYGDGTGSITINGGVLDVKATYDAAGIGGGYGGSAGNITINGGDITAQGGGLSAAIGSGFGYGAGGTVTINISGGTITAKGGSNNDGSGAGIGGGSTGAGGAIVITGGTITATPGSGSDTQAIGHGSGAEDSGTLTLGNNNVRIKVGTVSGNNVTYVGASQRISTAQGTAAVRAAVCDSHQYEQGACKWCGIDAPTCIVTWKNDDGTVLKTDTVKISVVPTYTGATPTKAATAQYTYTFDGWTPAVAAVTGNTTYTAKFKATTNQYTITWKNEDGTVLKTEKVAYGATPKYEGETPTKASDEQYHYTFSGWMPSVKAVTGNATYTASYTGTPRATLGDANGDGKVNVRDVTAIQRHASESELLTGDKLTAADVDGNGVVDIKDATAIQRYLAEFEGSYAIGTKI